MTPTELDALEKLNKDKTPWADEAARGAIQKLVEMGRRHFLLAEALINVLAADGVLAEDAGITGPNLLLCAETYASLKKVYTGKETIKVQRMNAGTVFFQWSLVRDEVSICAKKPTEVLFSRDHQNLTDCLNEATEFGKRLGAKVEDEGWRA